ncbi:hypothetical protein [Hydrocarboniphaga sp.]|uniref:hypothetical protein n=1 Tax=Hydrocarboniphaga sp. TaxID=2033016 RepID=UPI003D0BFA3A
MEGQYHQPLQRTAGFELSAALLSLTCLALSACGGGGGGGDSGSPDDGSVPLSSEADVLREVSLLSSAVGALDTLSGAIDGSSAFAAASASPRALATQAMSAAAATSDSPCTDGGTDTQSSGTKTRSFAYFGNLSGSVAYQLHAFAACKRTRTDDSSGVSYQATLDGAAEVGSTLQAIEGADYRYLIAGSGGTPLQATVTTGSAGAQVVLKATGTEESQSTDSLRTVGSIISLDYTVSALGLTSSGEVDLGSGSTPFYVATSKTSSAYSLDGPYAYHTSKCDGGSATADTTATLTTASDDAGSYINGGTLKLSTSSAAVTVVFNNDGSASYQFQGGSNGTLTRAELDQAKADGGCGF